MMFFYLWEWCSCFYDNRLGTACVEVGMMFHTSWHSVNQSIRMYTYIVPKRGVYLLVGPAQNSQMYARPLKGGLSMWMMLVHLCSEAYTTDPSKLLVQ